MITNKKKKKFNLEKDPEATYQIRFFLFGPFLRSFQKSGHVILFCMCANRQQDESHSIQYVTDCMNSIHYIVLVHFDCYFGNFFPENVFFIVQMSINL